MSENCVKNKPYNGCRGIQTVRMMVASLLQYDIYLAAQFPVTLGEFLQIVLIRHRGVRVAGNRNDWNVRLCKRLEMVERVIPEIIGFLDGKSESASSMTETDLSGLQSSMNMYSMLSRVWEKSPLQQRPM